jgi:hypothetical protein
MQRLAAYYLESGFAAVEAKGCADGERKHKSSVETTYIALQA